MRIIKHNILLLIRIGSYIYSGYLFYCGRVYIITIKFSSKDYLMVSISLVVLERYIEEVKGILVIKR